MYTFFSISHGPAVIYRDCGWFWVFAVATHLFGSFSTIQLISHRHFTPLILCTLFLLIWLLSNVRFFFRYYTSPPVINLEMFLSSLQQLRFWDLPLTHQAIFSRVFSLVVSITLHCLSHCFFLFTSSHRVAQLLYFLALNKTCYRC